MDAAQAKHDSRTPLRRPAAMAAAAALCLTAGTGLAAQEGEIPTQYDYDAAVAQSGVEGTYGYFRVLDGSATVVAAGSDDRIRAEVNEPVLVGDRVFITGGSRAELVLADRNVVRIGDGAELGFRALAYSGDSSDPSSILELSRGTLQLVVAPDQLGQRYPSVATPNASVEPVAAGSYLIVVDGDGRTEVVVREGRAEVLTDAQRAEVRPGESLFVEGPRGGGLRFAAAPGLDRLERWGQGLAEYGTGDYARYVDADLHYSASSLRGHGNWVHVGGSYAWRPYVRAGWRPYLHGRWRYTPSGLFWVSYEPWGWVPYHYGYWDHHSAHGWIWYPGRRFATAHVYWYWGPTYAAWVPSGYYWRHYGRHYGKSFGFHFGVYGHVGGGFGAFRHWTFLPHGRLGHRRQHVYAVGGHDLGRRRSAVERGVLFTDTRSLRPDTWRRPTETLDRLRRAGSRDGRSLPDARAFVERTPELPRTLERVAVSGRDARSAGGARLQPGNARPQTGDARAQGRDVRAPSRPRATVERGELLRPDSRERPANARPAAPDRSDRRGAAVRPNVRSTERPTVRPTERGALRPAERPTVRPTERGAVRPAERPTVRPTARPGGSSGQERRLARPERPVTREGASVQRPTTRRPVTRPAPARPEIRPSARAPAERPAVRSAPSRPTVQRVEPRSSRPALRPESSSRSTRPTVRSSAGGASRPTVRPSPSSRSRPTVRPSVPSSRPTVRPSRSSRSRPAVRPSAPPSRPTARPSPSRSRPTARPSAPRPTRPSVRRSGGGSSRPSVRRGGGSSSRPTVRRSGGSSSRPSVRRSGGSSSRPSVRRGGGSSSRPAVRRGGSGSRSGSARSRRGGGG